MRKKRQNTGALSDLYVPEMQEQTTEAGVGPTLLAKGVISIDWEWD